MPRVSLSDNPELQLMTSAVWKAKRRFIDATADMTGPLNTTLELRHNDENSGLETGLGSVAILVVGSFNSYVKSYGLMLPAVEILERNDRELQAYLKRQIKKLFESIGLMKRSKRGTIK